MTISDLKNERDEIDAVIQDLERKIYDLEAKKRQVEYDLAVAENVNEVS